MKEINLNHSIGSENGKMKFINCTDSGSIEENQLEISGTGGYKWGSQATIYTSSGFHESLVIRFMCGVTVINTQTILTNLKQGKIKSYDYNGIQLGILGDDLVNLPLLESLQGSGVTILPKKYFTQDTILAAGSPRIKLFGFHQITRNDGMIIGYGSLISASQESEDHPLDTYFIRTFDGKYLKEYYYKIPDFILNSIKNRTTETFGNIYSSNKIFKEYIDQLEGNSITNF